MIRGEEKIRELCRAVILETDRLVLQPLTLDDRPALCAILQDDRTMIHYGGAFDEAMTDAWLKRRWTGMKPSGSVSGGSSAKVTA